MSEAVRARPALAPPRPAVAARRRKRRDHGWLFVLPALLVSASVVLVPAAATIALAFTDWDGIRAPAFVGLANFLDLVADRRFWTALSNNLIYTAAFTTLPFAIALLVATLLMTIRRGRTAFQVVFFLPATIATVILARVWQGMIFSPVTGLFAALQQHGIAVADPLADPATALYGVMLVDMWHWWGFLTVIFFAALRQVNRDLIDAAVVDGAGRLQMFRHVLLPSILPTLMFMLLMTVIWSFKVFDWVFVLTEGGPGYSSEVLATMAYSDAFQSFQVGRASAGSVAMSLVGLAAIVTYLRLQARSERL
ncbi:carbohydrate ABC transporter permease [Falsiroseomonas sp. HW251]|uniref:carbohydrate ABC transporter permease n=1 Tax=Falsiroseomonas sp. HW251 TaxID=3390998 RepID=UPI003D30F50A